MAQSQHGQARLDVGPRGRSTNLQRKAPPDRVDDLGDGAARDVLVAFADIAFVAAEGIFDPAP
jgi:hypothetical protein